MKPRIDKGPELELGQKVTFRADGERAMTNELIVCRVSGSDAHVLTRDGNSLNVIGPIDISLLEPVRAVKSKTDSKKGLVMNTRIIESKR